MNKEFLKRRKFEIIVSLFLLLITFIVFGRVVTFDFINWDDPTNILNNPHVNGGVSISSIRWAFTSGGDLADYNPLVWLTHMIDCELYGLDPGGHHLTNVIFHASNAILLFLVLRFMTGALWSSAFVSAAFAIHPVHVESVAWITERRDVMYGFFWILTIGAYANFARRPRSFRRYLIVFLTITAALMSKSMAVTLPFVLFLLDYWPLRRISYLESAQDNERDVSLLQCPPTSLIRLIVEKLPFFIPVVLSSVITYILNQRQGTINTMGDLGLVTKLNNAVISYATYIWMMIWPRNLAILYPHPGSSFPMWQPIVSLIILVCISSGVIYAARRYRFLAVGWLWYLGTLFPVIGLVQVGLCVLADRYTYITSIGFFIMIAWGARELVGQWRCSKIGLGIIVSIVLTALMVCAWIQVGYWKDDITMFERTLKVTKNNWFIHNNYAITFHKKGRPDLACIQYNQILRYMPGNSIIHLNLATALADLDSYEDAIKHFNEALQIRPDWGKAYHYLGKAYSQQGKYELAIQHYNQALQLESDRPDTINELAKVLKEQGKIDEAIKQWENLLEIMPAHPDAHFNLGLTMAEQKQYDDAVKHFKQALLSKPKWAKAYYCLGLVYFQQGMYELAVHNYNQALRLEPGRIEIMDGLARLLATHKGARFYNPKGAIQLAGRACELTRYEHFGLLDTLAIAYAADGRFSEAIETAKKAIKLAESIRRKDLADEIRSRLQLYKAGRPYIEP